MCDSDPADRIRLLKPDTQTLLVNLITHITPSGSTKAGSYETGYLLFLYDLCGEILHYHNQEYVY